MKKFPLALSLLLLTGLSLGACSTELSSSDSTSSALLPAPPKLLADSPPQSPHRVQRVKFALKLPASFSTQAIASANFAKLEIRRGSNEPIYDLNADGNGFVSISGSSSTLSLSADVPDPTGDKWYVTIGLYINKDSAPQLEFKSAFNLPAAGSIPVDIRTHLLGGVVEELWALDPSLLETLSLNEIQTFLDDMTGLEQVDSNWVFSRLSSLNPPDPRSLSAHRIALKIMNESESLNLTTDGASQVIADFLPVPKFLGSYNSLIKNGPTYADSKGVFSPVAFDTFVLNQERVLFTDQDANNTNEHLYGIDALKIEQASNSSKELFDPVQVNTAAVSPAVGLANPTGSQPVGAAFTIQQTSTGLFSATAALKVYSTSDGSLLWSYNLPGEVNPSPGAAAAFAPVLRRTALCTCTAEREDAAIIALNTADADATNNPTTGIYAFKQSTGTTNGTQLWYYPTPLNFGIRTPIKYAPVLSADRSTIFAVDSQNELLILPLDADGNLQSGSVQIIALSTSVTTPLALGTNNNVYFVGSDGHLYAYGSSGSKIWDRLISASGVSLTPIIGHDSTAGQDIIYLLDKNKLLYAVYGNNTVKWSSPYSVSSDAELTNYTTPILGGGADGLRVLYLGLGRKFTTTQTITKIFAIQDTGSAGQEIWHANPQGNLWSGLGLHNGKLFVETLDGNYLQYSKIEVLGVEATAYPVDAPWPSARGNYGNAGISQKTMK